MTARRPAGCALLLAGGLVVSACAGTGSQPPSASSASSAAASSATGAITLYTCINDDAIQPIVQGFQAAHPGDRVDLFRAPTGQLNARVAADVRSGGLKADVVWACDPLTMAALVQQRLVGGWTPDAASDVPARYRTKDYVAAVLLYVVAVVHSGLPAPTTWSDLTTSRYGGAVAVPDPSVAASALGALGWFAAQRGYGMGFYRQLEQAGAVQVSTPDDVTTGVAQGQYKAGITIASSAYAAKAEGSPIDVAWPEPGAIAVYEPVAVSRTSQNRPVAQDFVSYLFGRPAQQALSAAGGYPVVPGVRPPAQPSDAPVVEPDWAAIASTRDAILAQYQQVFGG